MKKRSIISVVLYLAVLALLFSWIFGIFGNGGSDAPYSAIVELLKEGQVKRFVVEGQQIRLELHNPYDGEKELVCDLADPERFRQEM